VLTLFLVGLGGFVGAVARHGASGFVRHHWGDGFPMGTLLVNVLGCLLIGAGLGLAREHPALPEGLRLFLVVGLLGSFTTFSTLGHETVELLLASELRSAVISILGNLTLGLAAVWVGATVVS